MILKTLVYIVCCIFTAAYMSLFERKLIGKIQKRYGPDQCGIAGITQPIADSLKLILKRNATKNHSKLSIFIIWILLSASLFQLTLLPIINENKYALLLIAISHSIMLFSETGLGLLSRSKYGIMGGIRCYFQNIANHLPFIISILVIAMYKKDFSLNMPVTDTMPIYVSIPFAVLFFIIFLISTNKLPFDFAESESELVAGCYTEYGGIMFAMIYLSDYLNILFFALLISYIFIGTSNIYLITLTSFVVIFLCIVIRATTFRSTQDNMTNLAWKIMMPLLIIILSFC